MCFPSGTNPNDQLTEVAVYRAFSTVNPNCFAPTNFHTQQLNILHSYSTNMLRFDSGLPGANSKHYHRCTETMGPVSYKADCALCSGTK